MLPESRIKLLGILVLALLVVGTLGYMFMFGYGFINAFYMTVITLTTVGYGEVTELTALGRLFTIFIIVAGILVVAYAVDTTMEMLVEAQKLKVMGGRRKVRMIKVMSDHYILCGFGRMGQQIAREFQSKKAPFVAIDSREEAAQQAQEMDILFVHGDATQDRVLQRAGIDRAKGLIAVLGSDPENVYVTLTAKQVNPSIYVVARTSNQGIDQKLIRAGADKVVSPYEIGGKRIASAVLTPTVSDFVDDMMFAGGKRLHLDEVKIPVDSVIDRISIRDSKIRRISNCIIISIKRVDGAYQTNPKPDDRLFRGDILLALGTDEDINRLRKLVDVDSYQQLQSMLPKQDQAKS